VSDTEGAPVGATGDTPVTEPNGAVATATDLIIKAEDLTLRFGGVVSLRDVSFEMRRNEILAVIGPNGAGKTSLFNSLTGVYQPQEGVITFKARNGEPISVIGKKAYKIAQAGVSRTFQASRLFNALNVFENIKIGAEDHRGIGLAGALVRGPATRRGEHKSDDVVVDLLDFVGLSAEASLIASQLSYGARRRLEIARALATNPEVILLDEPAAGTNPSEKLELAELIRRVRDVRGVSVLLIEHDMKLVMSLAERLYVLNFGSVIAEGTPSEIRTNPTVIDAYLGTSHEDVGT
jgi:branched-chain amino acid transport system ATP-binding protein